LPCRGGRKAAFIEKGQAECLKKLLEHGIPVNTEAEGHTALHSAVHANRIGCMAVLLNACGINVNARNVHGDTPLHVAVASNNKAAIMLLLSSPKIKMNIQNNMGYAPLDIAKAQKTNDAKEVIAILRKRIKAALRPPLQGNH
jgi:ankyrin repeat protein